jgi:hypothetical protein
MGLASIQRQQRAANERRNRSDNGVDPVSLLLGQSFRQAVKEAAKEGVRAAILEMIPGVRAARWLKNKLMKVKGGF